MTRTNKWPKELDEWRLGTFGNMPPALAMVKGEVARQMGQRRRTFDWDEAARRIRRKGAKRAEAGLATDWETTGGCIFRDGKPDTKSHTYLASDWAEPMIVIDGGRPEPCWKYEKPGEKDPEKKWPRSAREILRGKTA